MYELPQRTQSRGDSYPDKPAQWGQVFAEDELSTSTSTNSANIAIERSFLGLIPQYPSRVKFHQIHQQVSQYYLKNAREADSLLSAPARKSCCACTGSNHEELNCASGNGWNHS